MYHQWYMYHRLGTYDLDVTIHIMSNSYDGLDVTVHTYTRHAIQHGGK